MLTDKTLIAFIMAVFLIGVLTGYLISKLPIITFCDTSIKYFFIPDSDFTIPLNSNIFWGVEAWNRNPDSVCEIRNETLHLFYNGTIDWSYGNSGVFQGKHADGRVAHQLLVGDSPENVFPQEYVIFPKSMQSGKFQLETKFRINKMDFNFYPIHSSTPNFSRVNLGITLMCAINNDPFNLEAQTLWLDVYFAGYCLSETHTWGVPKNWSYSSVPDDVHAGYFVEEVNPQDFGEWIVISVDLGDYISKTLNLITQVDIKTIRVYGFIVFVECLGAYTEVEYDYVRTVRK